MDFPAANPPAQSRSTLTDLGVVLPQIVANLRALQSNGKAAFGRVEIFTEANILKAFERLLAASTTVALVIWTGDEFEQDKDGGLQRAHGDVEVTILFCAQFMGDPTGAKALGGDDTTPGLFALRALVLPLFNGVLVRGAGNIPQTYAWLHSGECIPVNDAKRGRDVVAYRLTIKVNGGELCTELGPYPMP